MSEPIDVSGEPAGSVIRDGRFLLSLTGPDSHVLVTEPGRGNVIIGPGSIGKKADLRVWADDVVHWPAFDPFATPAGSPWPRHIDYHGNDSGFLRWSEQRPIEQFTWAPAFADARRVEAGVARIQTLQIRLDAVAGHLDIAVPADMDLGLFGDLSRITVTGACRPCWRCIPHWGDGPGRRLMSCPTWACCKASRRWRCTESRWRSPSRCGVSNAFPR